MRRRLSMLSVLLFCCAALLLSGCAAGSAQVVPTAQPTATLTPTATPTLTPDANASPTPTRTFTPRPAQAAGGPTPTPLFGPTATPGPDSPTATDPPNPNAARIEFFTSDSPVVAPGATVDLFWSTRGARQVFIYQLNRQGERTRVWNDAPNGSLTIQTRASDRGQLDFLLVAGEGENEVQQILSIPLICPVQWFFQPVPAACADEEAAEVRIIEQPFERGRMVYRADTDRVYVLFNDDLDPAWAVFANRYDPAIHPELDPNFPFLQPVAILGFLWRGNDTVRNRLGVALEPEVAFDGFVQVAQDSLYLSSTNGTVIEILPDGFAWQIIRIEG